MGHACLIISLPAQRCSGEGIGVPRSRVAAGMSGGELASRSRISRSMLSRVEHGLVTPSIGTLVKMASALELPIAALFHDDVNFWTPLGSQGQGHRVLI